MRNRWLGPLRRRMVRTMAAPSAVQLPGGIRLVGIQFKIIGRHEDGSPKTFEILPPGEKGDCSLYASEEWIRSGRI